jgi:hypothetical protein
MDAVSGEVSVGRHFMANAADHWRNRHVRHGKEDYMLRLDIFHPRFSASNSGRKR